MKTKYQYQYTPLPFQSKRMSVGKIQLSEVGKFRKDWLDKGFELINITTLCDLKLGESGWCNDFNEPDESCHHIQIWYRGDNIAVVTGSLIYTIDEDKYLVFLTEEDCVTGRDFIIFKKVKTLQLCKGCELQYELLHSNGLCRKCDKKKFG